MSIQISTSVAKNYNNVSSKNSTNNKKQNFNEVLNDKLEDYNEALNGKLDDEDKILYKQLKNAGIDLTNYSLDWHKNHIETLGFPPLTAPSSVRKSWREMLEKMPPQQREEFQHNITAIMVNMRYNNNELEQEMEKPNFSYSNFVNQMSNMGAKLKDVVGLNESLIDQYLNIFKEKLATNK